MVYWCKNKKKGVLYTSKFKSMVNMVRPRRAAVLMQCQVIITQQGMLHNMTYRRSRIKSAMMARSVSKAHRVWERQPSTGLGAWAAADMAGKRRHDIAATLIPKWNMLLSKSAQSRIKGDECSLPSGVISASYWEELRALKNTEAKAKQKEE